MAMDPETANHLGEVMAVNLELQGRLMALTEYLSKQAADPVRKYDEIQALMQRRHEELLLVLENTNPALAARFRKWAERVKSVTGRENT